MRILCLFFPRLGVQLVHRANPGLGGRPVALLDGRGDDAVVVAASSPDVVPGLAASAARRRSPGIRFVPDNAAACYDELERLASIIHANATPLVALGGRDHLFVDIRGLDSRFGDEPGVARGIAGIARTWSGLDLRAAVAGSRAEALAAARAARRGPLCVQSAVRGASPEPPIVNGRDDVLAAELTFPRAAGTGERRRALLRALRRLAALGHGRQEAPRAVGLRLDTGAGSSWRAIRPGAPLATEAALVEALDSLCHGDVLGDATHVRIELRSLVPLPAPAHGLAMAGRRKAVAAPARRGRQLMLAAG
ncbi:MAG: hypothetical protein Kow0010_03340 [Dehalococcoidia bacterium]